MYSNYGNYQMASNNTGYSYRNNMPYQQGSYTGQINRRPGDDRLVGGGFLFPFVLGGITGGLLAPAFYPRPYYPYPYYPRPYYQYPYYYR